MLTLKHFVCLFSQNFESRDGSSDDGRSGDSGNGDVRVVYMSRRLLAGAEAEVEAESERRSSRIGPRPPETSLAAAPNTPPQSPGSQTLRPSLAATAGNNSSSSYRSRSGHSGQPVDLTAAASSPLRTPESGVPSSRGGKLRGQRKSDFVEGGESLLSPDDFDFEVTVGKGGFGHVFVVRPRESALSKVRLQRGAAYALKAIRKAKLRNSLTEITHVRNEMRVLNRISGRHPFIVEMKASFQTKSHVFLLTELVSGGELFNLINTLGKDGRGLSEDMARPYMAEIAVALGWLHSKSTLPTAHFFNHIRTLLMDAYVLADIIFRDLKPENVMLAADGHVKLIDFGLCRERFVSSRRATYCGTKEYMAPEVYHRTKYGLPADWWSFGALSYDMVCNEYPYKIEGWHNIKCV